MSKKTRIWAILFGLLIVGAVYVYQFVLNLPHTDFEKEKPEEDQQKSYRRTGQSNKEF